MDDERVMDAVEFALDDTVLMLKEKVRDITPRDPRRPPKDLSRKVTGNLKRSISSEKKWKYKHIIGTMQSVANYGFHLEFWTRFMRPRSFLRLALIENEDEAKSHFIKIIRRRLWRFMR